MKKYIVLILFSLGLAQQDCQATEVLEGKENLNNENIEKDVLLEMRVSESVKVFEELKKKIDPIRNIAERFNFSKFSEAVLKKISDGKG